MTHLVCIRINLINKMSQEMQSDILPMPVIDAMLGHKSSDSKRSYLKRACKTGELIRVKNGLYLKGKEQRKGSYSAFAVANHISTPSYVSLESALSFYGLIPEAVYITTSVTTKKSFNKKSPIGDFSFSHLKTSYFNFGFYQLNKPEDSYLIATPLKSLMDCVVVRGKKYSSIDELIEDLRFDWDEFVSFEEFVNSDTIGAMLQTYKSHRLQIILKSMRAKL